MNKLIVHIGYGKCGSTTLQRSAFEKISEFNSKLLYNPPDALAYCNSAHYRLLSDGSLGLQKKFFNDEYNYLVSNEGYVNWNPQYWELAADLNLKLFGPKAVIWIFVKPLDLLCKSIYLHFLHNNDYVPVEDFILNEKDWNHASMYLSPGAPRAICYEFFHFKKLKNLYEERFEKVYFETVGNITNLTALIDEDFISNEVRSMLSKELTLGRKHNVSYSKAAVDMQAIRKRFFATFGMTPDNQYIQHWRSLHENRLSSTPRKRQYWRMLNQGLVSRLFPEAYKLPENLQKSIQEFDRCANSGVYDA